MMSAEGATRPTILLVPGAFHSSACFDSLRTTLTSLSYPSATYTLPSIASSDPFTADAIADGKFIRSKLKDLIQAGKYVLLVMHSYAGIPGAAAAYGLSEKQRRQQGEKGGVIALVFISAVLTKEGESCIQKMGGVYPSYSLYNVSLFPLIEPSSEPSLLHPSYPLIYGRHFRHFGNELTGVRSYRRKRARQTWSRRKLPLPFSMTFPNPSPHQLPPL